MTLDYLSVVGKGINNQRLTISKLNAENEYLRNVIEDLVDDLNSIPESIINNGYIDIHTHENTKIRLVRENK